jgi:hypothetical protein
MLFDTGPLFVQWVTAAVDLLVVVEAVVTGDLFGAMEAGFAGETGAAMEAVTTKDFVGTAEAIVPWPFFVQWVCIPA